MTIDAFSAYVVRKDDQGQIRGGIEQLGLDQLADGEVLVRVRYSSLNYKDALAATGHPGVVRTFPHVPGVDAAGTVVEDASGSFAPGSEVIGTTMLQFWKNGDNGPVTALATVQILITVVFVAMARKILGVKIYG